MITKIEDYILFTHDIAAVIGNGPSRKGVDLSKLDAILIGCNAIHREHNVDYIIAIDPIPVWEIFSSECFSKLVHTLYKDQFESEEYHGIGNPRPRNNAGMIAMDFAIKGGLKKIHCYGIDFMLTKNNNEVMENIFAGTLGYDGSTSASVEDVKNRLKYFKWFAEKHSTVEFSFYVPEGYKLKELGLNNIREL